MRTYKAIEARGRKRRTTTRFPHSRMLQMLRSFLKCKQNGHNENLPGVNPSDPSAVEGHDHFANGELLRKHLCAFGIGY